jgi:inorganic pyrophosphatase
MIKTLNVFLIIYFIFLKNGLCEINNINFFKDVPIKSENGKFQTVVEIESGENDKWEIIKKNGKIKIEKIDQEIPRKIKYLSYPFNYGIIPQTILTTEEGGDGDALDVVLLGEKLKRGSIEEIIILGALNFIDSGDNDLKIIAINESSIIFKNIKNFDDLENNYNGVLDIIKLWFLNYKGQNRVYYDKTLDVNETKQIIEKAHKNFKFYLNNLENND